MDRNEVNMKLEQRDQIQRIQDELDQLMWHLDDPTYTDQITECIDILDSVLEEYDTRRKAKCRSLILSR